MKSSFIAWVLVLSCAAATPNWEIALPGYQYVFPRDHFEHRQYQTEWWYYTGNLRANDGRHFGFELTFFRQAVPLPTSGEGSNNTWRPDQVYLAHFALSNIDGREFFHTE